MQRDVDGTFKAFKGRCFPGFDKENRLNLARSTTPRVGRVEMGAGIAEIWKTVSSNEFQPESVFALVAENHEWNVT